MLVVILLIIGTPIIYFTSIGKNPFKDSSIGTKVIAIVNEDSSTEKEQSTLDFGKEVVPILSKDSAYDWKMVSRSTAEKGVEKKEYDAIVYIPSNFSKNIMSYEEQNPIKAEFKYMIGEQLNTANREKVLREINKSTTRVNDKISTLYWSYISQDIEKVRKDFDNILQAEVNFLDTISKYYQPSLSGVIDNINAQKNLLEGLQSSLTAQRESIEGNEELSKQFEENLSQFVTFVNEYEEFQKSQQTLLQMLQDDNQTSIVNLKNDAGPRYENVKNYLQEQNTNLNNNLLVLKNQMVSNEKDVTALSKQVVTQREEIISLLKEVEGELFIQYELDLKDLKNKLATPSSSSTQENNTKASKLDQINVESKKLASLVQDMESLKTTITVTEENDSVMNILSGLEEQIKLVEGNIQSLVGQEKGFQAQMESQAEDVDKDQILIQIKQLENEILNSNNISESKKPRLTKIVNQQIISSDITVLMDYYATLKKYQSALANSLYLDENSKELASNLNSILGLNEDEQTILNQLAIGMPASQQQLSTLQGNVSTFFNNHMKNLEIDYEETSNLLDSIEESAINVKERISILIADAPSATSSANGDVLETSQQSISQGLQAIHESVKLLEDNQSNIIDVSNELQSKAQGVNNDTNTLSLKWSANVGATEKYRNDIHAVLNNAFIDGQKNGLIFDYLSNPLAANSMTTTVEQEEKEPPVVVLVIVLISSLLIGYFSYYFKNANNLVRYLLFMLLNLIVGLIISIYGLEIYPLDEKSSIEWTIFTILLILATSSMLFASFTIHQLVGWIVNVGIIAFYITPMLTLLATNINFEDPMSKVYISIQYGPESLLTQGTIITALIIIISMASPFLFKRISQSSVHKEESSHES